MRFSLLALLAASFAVAGPASASAATVHVDPAGSDAATGTADAPLQTIGRAVALAARGDTVLVAPGRYPEYVYLNGKSGITFRGEVVDGARAVIDGEGRYAYGFNVNGNDVAIQNFEITGQTDAGVYSQGVNGTIAGNVIH